LRQTCRAAALDRAHHLELAEARDLQSWTGSARTQFGIESSGVNALRQRPDKQIAPSVKRVAAMFNPNTAPYVTSYYLSSFDAAARSLKMEASVAPVRSDAEIESVITSLGSEPKGGLVVMSERVLT
jgi:hypothetical protein